MTKLTDFMQFETEEEKYARQMNDLRALQRASSALRVNFEAVGRQTKELAEQMAQREEEMELLKEETDSVSAQVKRVSEDSATLSQRVKALNQRLGTLENV